MKCELCGAVIRDGHCYEFMGDGEGTFYLKRNTPPATGWRQAVVCSTGECAKRRKADEVVTVCCGKSSKMRDRAVFKCAVEWLKDNGFRETEHISDCHGVWEDGAGQQIAVQFEIEYGEEVIRYRPTVSV